MKLTSKTMCQGKEISRTVYWRLIDRRGSRNVRVVINNQNAAPGRLVIPLFSCRPSTGPAAA